MEKSYGMSFPITDWNFNHDGQLKNTFVQNKDSFGNIAFVKDETDMYIKRNVLLKKEIEGVDIPVKIHARNNNSKGVIMIIGESPVRNTRKINDNGLYIGTPFAVACKDIIPTQCKIYKNIFRLLLEEDYDVYITDAVKIWYKGLVKKDFKKNINQKLLSLEKEKVNPILTVAWGETAIYACEKVLQLKEKEYLPQTHPVKLNWDRWKVKMLTDAIKNHNEIGLDYVNTDNPDDSNFLAQFIAKEILNKI